MKNRYLRFVLFALFMGLLLCGSPMNSAPEASGNTLMHQYNTFFPAEQVEEYATDFQEISYYDLHGETYYFYGIVDQFLHDITRIINDGNSSVDLRGYFGNNEELPEKIMECLASLQGKSTTLSEYKLGKPNGIIGEHEESTLDVPVLIHFVCDGQNDMKTVVLYIFSVKKTALNGEVWWRITHIRELK